MGVKMGPNYNCPLVFLCENYEEDFFFHPKTQSLFKINHTKLDPDDDIIQIKKLDTDVYEYEFRYYNGGAGFHEYLEEAIDKI